MEALVLGCTHYPLIRREVEDPGQWRESAGPARHRGPRGTYAVNWRPVDSSTRGDTPSGDDHFFLSDLGDSFAKSARRFFRRSMTVEEMRLWDR